MANKKVKGIRARGNTFMVDVTVNGKRDTKGGFKSYDDALAYHNKLTNAKTNGGDLKIINRSDAQTKTLADAYKKPMRALLRLGSDSEKTAIHNADGVLKFLSDNKELKI